MNATVEQLWLAGRRRANASFDTRRPGATVVDVLLALADGPAHGGAIARTTGRAQNGVTFHVLPRLDRFGFVVPRDVVLRVPRGNSTTTSRAREWSLTRAGRELAHALLAERRGAVSPLMPGREYWITDAGLSLLGAGRSALPRRRVSTSESRYWPVVA